MSAEQPPYDVVGVGVVAWDTIGVIAQEPVLGIKQPLTKWLEGGGGPVPTALIALSRLHMRTHVISAVGSDGYGQRIIDDLQRAGVDTSIHMQQGGRSHVAFALVEPHNGRRTIWWHNDPDVFGAVSLNREQILSARALLIDTHLPHVTHTAAQWMHEAGKPVIIDAERFKPHTVELLPFCSGIVVSERFGRESTGEEDPALAAQALFERYHDNNPIVVVTAGEHGSWCVSREGAFHTPAFSVEVQDTTGAGDVFHGGFLYGLLHEWPLRKTVRFASAVAACKCRGIGGRGALPTLDDIRQLMKI